MLIVTDLNGIAEPAIDFNGLEIYEEVNGDFSLTSTFLNTEHNRHAWPLIAEESLIEHDGHEFRIKNINKGHYRKPISARHIFFDLIGHYVYGINGGTKTPDDAFSFILDGSGWTFEVVGDIPAALLPNFGEDNAISLIRAACTAFKCEIKIMPGKHLEVHREIGKDDDYQFRYKHNIKAINETVDTSKLATVIKGYGANGLEVEYRSPNVAVFGEIHAEPIRDERFTIAESLIEQCKLELVDYPEISIEIEAVLLEGAELGDKVWLIHEPLGIEFQTRIMAKKSRPQSPSADTVTLGNRKQQMSDLLTETKIEIKENQKQVRSRFDQTNERITLEVEAVNESIAAVVLEANNIKLSVEEVEQSVAAVNIRADNIVLSVQDLGGRVGSAEAQLSIQAGEISSKVSQDGVMSAIYQSPEAIKMQASRLDMLGIVNVADTLTIGNGFGTFASVRFNGTDSWINTYGGGLQVSSGGNFDVDANSMTFNNTTVDLSTARDIIWGSNGPTNVAFASNAAYAQSAGSANSLGGYGSSDFVKDSFGQGLGLYIDNSTGRLVVRRNGSVVGSLPWN